MQIEENLKLSHERLFLAQNMTKLAFWDWNILTGDLFWSDETYRMFGFEPNEFSPSFDKFQESVHPDDLAYVQQSVNAALEKDSEYNIDFRYVLPNGEIGFLNAQGQVTRDLKGNAIRFFGTQLDITEHKLVEENSKKSEDKLKYLLSTNPAIIYSSKASGDFGATYISENIETQTGYKPEDFTGDSQFWVNNIYPDERERILSEMGSLFEDGIYEHEYRFRYKDGTYHWMNDTMKLIHDEKGEPKEIIGSWRDITARKEFEDKLRAHSRKIEILNQIILLANKAENLDDLIKDVFNSTNELMNFDGGGIYLADYDEKVANLVYTTGLPQEFIDAVKQCPLEVEPYKNLFYGKEPIFSENWHINDPVFAEKSGLLALAVIPILSKDVVIGAINVATKKNYVFSEEEKDILQYIGREVGTVISKMQVEFELKQHRDHLEEMVERRTGELKKSEERYKELYESAPNAYFSIGKDSRIIQCNNSSTKLLGYSKEELLNMNAFEMYNEGENGVEKAKSIFQRFLNGENIHDEEVVMRDKSGNPIWISLTVSPIKDERGQIIESRSIVLDITERKEAEEKIKKEKEKADLYLNLAGVIIVALNKDGNITLLNRKGYEILEYEEGDLLGKDWFDTCLPESVREEVKKVFHESMLNNVENVRFFENFVRTKTGKEKIVAWHNAILYDDDNKVIGTLSSGEDITERKKAEAQVMEEKAFSESIIEGLPEVFFIADEQKKFLTHNKTLEKITGYTSEELSKLTPLDLTPKDELKKVGESIKNGFITGSVNVESGILTKDGNIIPHYFSAKKLVIKGKPYLMGMGVNISEKKIAEEKLKKSEEQYRLITDTSMDSIYQLNKEGEILFMNPAGAKMYGYEPEEIIDMNFNSLMTEEGLAEGYEIVGSVLSGQSVRGETHVKHRKGHKFPIQYSMVPIIKEGNVIGFSGISRDITERKESEKKIEETLEELKRSNAELEQFAYVASHDLQEPLRMVASFTQLLQKRYHDKLDEDANEFIGYAVDGATRMQRLIKDLLTFSRVGTRGKDFTSVDMNVIYNVILNNLMHVIKETNAEITCDPLPIIKADESQMLQLFQNLISNAIKFHGDNSPRIHLSSKVKGNEWIFSVKDNGIGIDEKYSKRIFIIFQRLHKKNEFGGTGIGLAVCKKIVQRHGGKIWVESEQGKGSTFYFTISKKPLSAKKIELPLIT